MSSQLPAAGGSHQDAVGDGYFAPLASARYMLLTTFKPDGGAPMNSAVRVAVDSDRAYFRTWSGSGASKRIGFAGRVQVAPCTVLGLCSFGPPFNATARLLAGEQACAAARKLASKRPARRRLLVPLSGWMRRWQPVHYELLADEALEPPGRWPGAEGLKAGVSREVADPLTHGR
jgi:PPOX class probable F420-dependent enzyme